MAKRYKIKRSYSGGSFYRAKPHPVMVVLSVIVLGALVFLGITLYRPVTDFFERLTDPSEVELDLPSESEPESQPEPEPKPDPVVTYPEMRAVYLPAAVLADDALLNETLESIRGTDLNTVLVDIKDSNGNILYNTANRQAAGWGAVAEAPLDLRALSERLNDEKLMLAVRMFAFQDGIAASSDRDNAIRYQDTEWLWLDNAQELGGKPWLNPYSEEAKQYITSLALESAEMGARLVILESFQFPTGSEANANFGPRAGVVARGDILKNYMAELSAKLREKGTRTAFYLTAASLAQEAENESRYGGGPLYIAGDTVVIGALPSQFHDGFTYGSTVVSQPLADPGAAVSTALSMFLDGSPLAGDAPAYIPMIQGGNESGLGNAAQYTKAQVEAQIEAVTARGIHEYILYSASGEQLLLGTGSAAVQEPVPDTTPREEPQQQEELSTSEVSEQAPAGEASNTERPRSEIRQPEWNELQQE